MKILSRIERLEDELLPLPAGPLLRINVVGVDTDGTRESALVFEVPLTPPPRRPWRTYRGPTRRDW
jgi:hypothetical protein